MAIRGMKRTSEAVQKTSNARTARSTKQRCAAVAKAVSSSAGGYPGKLLASMAASALLPFNEDRHAYQTDIVKSISEALAAKEEAIKKAISEHANMIEDPDGDRIQREKHVEDAATKLAILTASVEQKKTELRCQSAATQTSIETAKRAKHAAKVLNKRKYAAESETIELNSASQCLATACGAALLARVLKMAKSSLKCDKAMLDALPAVLKHDVEERTDFAKSTVSALKGVIAAKVAELSASLEKYRPELEESESAAREAESVRDEAVQADRTTRRALDDLENQLMEATQELKATVKKRVHFVVDMKRLMDSFDKMKADLAALLEGPVRDFAVLEAHTAQPQTPTAAKETAQTNEVVPSEESASVEQAALAQ